jgi:hypothetical protein
MGAAKIDSSSFPYRSAGSTESMQPAAGSAAQESRTHGNMARAAAEEAKCKR